MDERIDRICEKFRQLWHKHPEQRFGQVLENYVFGHHLERDQCIFHVQDEEAEERMDEVAKLDGIPPGVKETLRRDGLIKERR